MRVIVQPFSIVFAPNGIIVMSAASTVVAITNRARDGVYGASCASLFVVRLLRVRIFASWPWRRCLGDERQVSCKGADVEPMN